MSELVEWLRPLIVARKATAQSATPGPWSYNPGKQWHDGDDFVSLTDPQEFVGYGGPSPFRGAVAITGPAGNVQSMADAEHIALNDPRDVIARCDFELALLDTYEAWKETAERDASKVDALDVLAWAVLRLATAYRHFDGYKEEWS